MLAKNLYRGKRGPSILALGSQFNGAIILLEDGDIDQEVIQIMKAINYRMVYFDYLAVFKLHRKLTVGFGIFGDGQCTGSLLVQPMAYLSIGGIIPGKGKDVCFFYTVLECGNKCRFIDDYIILIFEKD